MLFYSLIALQVLLSNSSSYPCTQLHTKLFLMFVQVWEHIPGGSHSFRSSHVTVSFDNTSPDGQMHKAPWKKLNSSKIEKENSHFIRKQFHQWHTFGVCWHPLEQRPAWCWHSARSHPSPSSALLGQSGLLSQSWVMLIHRSDTPGHCHWPESHLKIVVQS